MVEQASPVPHAPQTTWRVRPQLSVSACVPQDFPAAEHTAASGSPTQIGEGVTQRPWQRCVPTQTSHAFPLAPQTSGVFPTWQAPEASQQPAQFAGPQRGVCVVGPQAKRKRATQPTSAEEDRTMLLSGEGGAVF